MVSLLLRLIFKTVDLSSETVHSLSHLLRVYLADEGDCAEILKAERGELEELQRHEGHHDVQPVEAHLGRAQRLLLLVSRAALRF